MRFRSLIVSVVIICSTNAAFGNDILDAFLFSRGNNTFLSVRVKSNGCTTKDSFEHLLTEDASGKATVRLERKGRDECKAWLPEGVLLVFPLTELRLSMKCTISTVDTSADMITFECK